MGSKPVFARFWLVGTINPDVLCLQEVRFAQEGHGTVCTSEKWHWAQVDASFALFICGIWSQREPVAIHRA